MLPIDRALDIRPEVRIPPKDPICTVVAVSMADQLVEPCIVAVRYSKKLETPGDPMFGEDPVFSTEYTVLGAERLAPDALYPQVARRVNVVVTRLYNHDDRGDYHVLCDASSVGTPIVDALRNIVIPYCHVTAVKVDDSDRGDLSILWRHNTRIGLEYLISRLQAIFQGHRLYLPEIYTNLVDELQSYRIELDRGPDLIRTLALACASEYQPITYGPPFDDIGSPIL